MSSFDEWSEESEEDVGGQNLRLVKLVEGKEKSAVAKLVEAVPTHYTSTEHVARVFENLGKPGVAELLRTKLPTDSAKRSGDLGEILATEYIQERTVFETPVKRLRWKDHREMSMRGDDVIGVQLPDDSPIRFLKVEAKSQAALKTATVTAAREALDRDDGLPSSHALTFMSARLIEIGEPEIADAIDMALLRDGITMRQVSQMIFTFSSNAPDAFLKTDLKNYNGLIRQLSVGLRIKTHQDFIASVYDKVKASDES